MHRFEIAASPEHLSALRRQVGVVLEASEVDARLRTDALIVVSELASNAIEATRDGTIEVTVDIHADLGSLEISVINNGVWHADPTSFVVTSSDLLRGRGLGITRAVSDTLSIRAVDGRTIVDARLTLPDR